jgi:hypothetical protein
MAAALLLSPVTLSQVALADGIKTLSPANPGADLQIKARGGGVIPGVHCSTGPSQTLQPCNGDFKAWCKLVGGTYGSTSNPGVDACFSSSEW